MEQSKIYEGGYPYHLDFLHFGHFSGYERTHHLDSIDRVVTEYTTLVMSPLTLEGNGGTHVYHSNAHQVQDRQARLRYYLGDRNLHKPVIFEDMRWGQAIFSELLMYQWLNAAFKSEFSQFGIELSCTPSSIDASEPHPVMVNQKLKYQKGGDVIFTSVTENGIIPLFVLDVTLRSGEDKKLQDKLSRPPINCSLGCGVGVFQIMSIVEDFTRTLGINTDRRIVTNRIDMQRYNFINGSDTPFLGFSTAEKEIWVQAIRDQFMYEIDRVQSVLRAPMQGIYHPISSDPSRSLAIDRLAQFREVFNK